VPNRILRDNILTSEAVASLDWAAEVFYRRLHSIVDDYGRHEAGQQLLRAKCYPLQTDSVRVLLDHSFNIKKSTSSTSQNG
jgi:hypothetical protein